MSNTMAMRLAVGCLLRISEAGAPLGLRLPVRAPQLDTALGTACSSNGSAALSSEPTASALDLKTAGGERPNIVIIVFDDLGFNDLGRFALEEGGQDLCQAPVMDGLMAEGVKLKQFYALPICSPTRAALMTGRYPIRYGGQLGTAEGVRTWIPDGEPIFPKRLAAVGYQTQMVGKWHLGHGDRRFTPTGQGFQSFYGLYRGGGDHWTHQIDLGADTRDGGAWPGEDQLRFPDSPFSFGPYSAPSANAPVDLKREQWLGAMGASKHQTEFVFSENGTHSAELIGREAAAVIDRHDKKSGPLFLYVAHHGPHWPIQPTASGWLRNDGLTRAGASVRRQHWCGIVTACDDSVGRVVRALEARDMLKDTVIVAFSDNGGDVTTGASNHPYRGTKMTPWEGGTRVAAFVHSLNDAIVPPSSRGRNSHALSHVVDLFPSLCALAGCDASPASTGPLDGMDVWNALVRPGHSSPRKEMVYNVDPVGLGIMAGGFAAGKGTQGIGGNANANANSASRANANANSASRISLRGNVPEDYAAIRVGGFKLVEGMPGRGDWMGSDPASAWRQNYIMGPDAMDYDLVRSGGRLGDMSLGDGGQAAVAGGAKFDDVIKRLWLFDIDSDPLEQRDLSAQMPDKVRELQARLQNERRRMAEPLLLQVGSYSPLERKLSMSDVARDTLTGRPVMTLWADAAERAGDGVLAGIKAKLAAAEAREASKPHSKL